MGNRYQNLPKTVTSYATVDYPTYYRLLIRFVIMAADELDFRCNFVALYSAKFPHILEHIFFSLDYESYMNCMEVSNEWKGVLNSERYITKRKSIFKVEIERDEQMLCNAVQYEWGTTDVVRMLLASGMVDVNCRDPAVAMTPLHLAAKNIYGKELCQILIEHGADPNVADGDGQTPLHIAAQIAQIPNIYGKEVSQLLIEHDADPNVADGKGITPLHLAASWNHKEVSQLLIEHGADPNVADGGGRTPLHWAARIDVMNLLIENGADPNVVENHGQTPLHQAAQRGLMKVVKLLIEHGADPNVTDENGLTPLHCAARYGYKNLAELLIGRGADPNMADNIGQTPLHCAAQEGKIKVTELLIESGADMDKADNRGMTPHDMMHQPQ